MGTSFKALWAAGLLAASCAAQQPVAVYVYLQCEGDASKSCNDLEPGTPKTLTVDAATQALTDVLNTRQADSFYRFTARLHSAGNAKATCGEVRFYLQKPGYFIFRFEFYPWRHRCTAPPEAVGKQEISVNDLFLEGKTMVDIVTTALKRKLDTDNHAFWDTLYDLVPVVVDGAAMLKVPPGNPAEAAIQFPASASLERYAMHPFRVIFEPPAAKPAEGTNSQAEASRVRQTVYAGNGCREHRIEAIPREFYDGLRYVDIGDHWKEFQQIESTWIYPYEWKRYSNDGSGRPECGSLPAPKATTQITR
jgi:hypothetical protein